MSAHIVTLPTGGALNFRNLKGQIILIDRRNPTPTKIDLDSSASVEGNRAVVAFSDTGVVEASPTGLYHDLQFYLTVNLTAGTRIVTDKGVFDSKGKSIKTGSLVNSHKIAVEVNATAYKGPNVWISWTVNRVGNQSIKLFADGKLIKTRAFSAVEVPTERFDSINSLSELLLTIHPDTRAARRNEKIFVGDVVAFSLSLADFQSTKELRLEN